MEAQLFDPQQNPLFSEPLIKSFDTAKDEWLAPLFPANEIKFDSIHSTSSEMDRGNTFPIFLGHHVEDSSG